MNTRLQTSLALAFVAIAAACGTDVAGPVPESPELTTTAPSAKLYLQKRGPLGTSATFHISATGGNLTQGSTVTINACPENDGTPACAGIIIWNSTGPDIETVTVTEVSFTGNVYLDWINVIGEIDGTQNNFDPVEPVATIRVDGTRGGLVRFKNAAGEPPALRVVKTALNDHVQAGGTIGFVMDVYSDGPGIATGVWLTDALPGGNGISWSTSTAGCTINGTAPSQTLSCNFGDMAAGTSRSVTVTSSTTTASCGQYSNTVVVGSTNHDMIEASAWLQIDGCRPPQTGIAGCTPGFWKQSQHFQYWTAPYTPTTLFDDVFANAFPGRTLLDVVKLGGGGLNALGRHTVAALLNAASPDVQYGMDPADVISAFDAAFASGDYETQKNIFERGNERGCTAKD